MKTEKIDVLVSRESPEKVASDKLGTSSAKEPKQEVEGRYWTTRLMRCWNCGGVSYINYDTNHYHAYTCTYCGAVCWD